MAHSLIPHPDTPCAALRELAVEIERCADVLTLRYVARGEIGALALPEPRSSGRSDGLWHTTCFEAFVMAAPPGYREFNLAPSLAWAAYRFDDYRAGMADLDMPPPVIALDRSARCLTLAAALRLPDDAAIRLGLSAVIETRGGQKSYWALAHPPGPPDFHHRDCFALELPPPPQP